MPAYSFKERFVSDVKAGIKTQTIRTKRKHQIKAGDPVYLYYGMRTKFCTKIGEGICTGVADILIANSGILIEGVGFAQGEDLESIAKSDGFENWETMKRWWKKINGLPFKGEIIFWKLA